MIIAYTGKTGSGKTYLMVKRAYQRWKKGENIYSNTYLFFARHISKKKYFKETGRKETIFELEKNFNKYAEKLGYGFIKYFDNITDVIHVKDCTILFDEAQVLFNARNWESLPTEFQHKLQQSRKHKVDLICTTQNLRSIDVTYRRLIHEWIACRNIFQLGSSPKILLGIFRKEFKDVDELYESVDELKVNELQKKRSFFLGGLFFINYFSRVLYDTMFDIGFKKLKLIWLVTLKPNFRKEKYLIIPKEMSPLKAKQMIKNHMELMKL